MQKNYDRINWENYPSTQTALNETNLNHMDSALDAIDNIVVDWDVTKAETSELLTALSGWSINNDTGVVTLTYKNGSTQTINTNISKIATNIEYDAQNERLVLTLPDGSKSYVDMSALITQYEFTNTTTIGFEVTSAGKVKANILDGSVTENKLQPNFLADCRSAESGASTAKLEAEGFAVGQQNGVDVGTDSPYYHNNAKYYSDKAGGSTLVGLTDTDIINPTNKQVLAYDSDTGKWINEDVDLDSKGDTLAIDTTQVGTRIKMLQLKSGSKVLSSVAFIDGTDAIPLIADGFNIDKEYKKGDYVYVTGLYGGDYLFKCVMDCVGIYPSRVGADSDYWVRTTVGNELSAGGGGSVKYNPDTDCLDVYYDGELVGSMPCGFQAPVELILPRLTSNDGNTIASLDTTNAWKVFSDEAYMYSGAFNNYIGYSFPVKRIVKSVSIANNNGGYAPKNVKLQGSDDGSTWEDVMNYTNSNAGTGAVWSFEVDNPVYFKKWRILIVTGFASAGFRMGDVRFYGN